MEQKHYDFKRFTEEDLRLYREILESVPFDPELNAFFVEQYHKENRRRYRERRYLVKARLRFAGLSHVPSPEEELIRKETLFQLDDAMGRLHPRMRKRIILHYGQELPFAAIAKRERVSAAAVGQSVEKGVRRLRRALKIRKKGFREEDS